MKHPTHFRNHTGQRIEVMVKKASAYYCTPARGTYPTCPYCGRFWTVGMGHPGSRGFRAKSQQRHVFSCFEKALASLGYQLGKYHGSYMLHRAEPLA